MRLIISVHLFFIPDNLVNLVQRQAFFYFPQKMLIKHNQLS